MGRIEFIAIPIDDAAFSAHALLDFETLKGEIRHRNKGDIAIGWHI